MQSNKMKYIIYPLIPATVCLAIVVFALFLGAFLPYTGHTHYKSQNIVCMSVKDWGFVEAKKACYKSIDYK
jgi:hypothetical protein